MSEIMLGVLRMPDELFWRDDPLTRQQHNAIRKEAADEIDRLRAKLAETEGQAAPVALDHIACIEDGNLRYMSGRKPPKYDCELYAMPGGGRAPKLYAAPVAPAVPEGWPTDAMVIRGAEALHGALHAIGLDIDWDQDRKGGAIQQGIAEGVFNEMIEAAPKEGGE